MIKLGAGAQGAPAWLAARLGGSSPPDGREALNQHLPGNGQQIVTNPVKTTHTIFNKGVQGEFDK